MKIKVNALVPYLLTFVKEYIAYIFAKYYLWDFSYSVKDMTFCSGILFRSLLEKEELHKQLLNVEVIKRLVILTITATFDVASDAIDSFIVIYIFNKRDY